MFSVYCITSDGNVFKGNSDAETVADALAKAQKVAQSNGLTITKATVKLLAGKESFKLVERRKQDDDTAPVTRREAPARTQPAAQTPTRRARR